MAKNTDLLLSSEDAGKKVYRKKEIYTLTLEQDAVANSEEKAQEKFHDQGGISYKDLRDVAVDGIDVETYFIDADYNTTISFDCLGTVNEEGEIE
jgi:hypothetical protein